MMSRRTLGSEDPSGGFVIDQQSDSRRAKERAERNLVRRKYAPTVAALLDTVRAHEAALKAVDQLDVGH
jgi:hypothetical protein